jgi:hypothetical protein
LDSATAAEFVLLLLSFRSISNRLLMGWAHTAIGRVSKLCRLLLLAASLLALLIFHDFNGFLIFQHFVVDFVLIFLKILQFNAILLLGCEVATSVLLGRVAEIVSLLSSCAWRDLISPRHDCVLTLACL